MNCLPRPLRAIAEVTGMDSMEDWNDDPSRAQQQVLDALTTRSSASKALIRVAEAQIRKIQAFFREVNDRIAEITERLHEPASGFICECGREDCSETIQLALADFQDLRKGEDLFIAAPGPCVEGVDRLVESREGYDVLVQV